MTKLEKFWNISAQFLHIKNAREFRSLGHVNYSSDTSLFAINTRNILRGHTHTGLKRQTVLDKHGIYIKAVKRRPR